MNNDVKDYCFGQYDEATQIQKVVDVAKSLEKGKLARILEYGSDGNLTLNVYKEDSPSRWEYVTILAFDGPKKDAVKNMICRWMETLDLDLACLWSL